MPAVKSRPTGRRATIWLAGAVVAVSVAAACRQGVPVIDTTPQPAEMASGTISGTVRGPQGTTGLAGRDVEAINVDTGERVSVRTSTEGGFTVKVKPGKYRLSVNLQSGETIVKDPGVINVNRSDLDAQRDIVIGQSRLERPQHRSSAIPEGLGPPIA
jgi:hypothetical protein